MNDIERAKDILKQYNQEHIIRLFDKINEEKQVELAKQVINIDFHKITELYENTKKEIEIKEKDIQPISYVDKEKLTPEEKDKYDKLGEEVIRKGQYAVVTMAGGQGTRLGHSGPKGTFKLDVYGKGKYLFEIFAENLKEANKKYDSIIPWYIMTSRENNKETKEFLEKNNYFGYDKNYVTLFIQGELPLVDTNGKVLVSREMKIKEASDGNGGTYASLRSSGALSDMKERGIKWIFIGGVDNALLKMADVACWPWLHTTLIEDSVASGTPLVVKMSDNVSHFAKEKAGVFMKCGDCEELAKALLEAQKNNEEYRLNALMARDKYSYATLVERLNNESFFEL